MNGIKPNIYIDKRIYNFENIKIKKNLLKNRKKKKKKKHSPVQKTSSLKIDRNINNILFKFLYLFFKEIKMVGKSNECVVVVVVVVVKHH